MIGLVAVVVILMSTSIYFSSGGNGVNLGEGSDVVNIKESTGMTLIVRDGHGLR